MLKSFAVTDPIRISRIYSFFQTVFTGGYRFPGELHNFWECVYVRQGEVCASADGKVYTLTEGHLIFHRPMEFHGLYVEEGKQAKLLIFSFAAEKMPEECLQNSVFSLESRQIGILTSLIDYVEQAYAKMQKEDPQEAHWYQRYYPLFADDPKCLQMVVTYLYQLILSLPNSERAAANSTRQDAEIFQRAVEYMQLNLHTPMPVAQLARHVNASESSLLRIFRKYAQTSVHRYFLLMKIKAAVQMLECGMGVGQAAEKLGFGNASYFSVCFKRETGKMPTEIRKSE